jgi:hypothetical protein
LLHKYTESGYETVLTAACARQGCSAMEWVSVLAVYRCKQTGSWSAFTPPQRTLRCGVEVQFTAFLYKTT